MSRLDMGTCKWLFIAVIVLLSCAGRGLAEDGQFRIDPNEVLKGLDRNHPRLMLKDADLQGLKRQYAHDKVLQKCIKDVIERADKYLQGPKLKHHLIGPRMLHISRRCLQPVYALGLAWRWTGEEKYARKLEENLLTVCAFEDWNPSHFLDTAEMSHAVGVGYDWLYSWLDKSTREEIKAGLIKHGLEEGLQAYEQKLWWTRSRFNWNQVCNGGMIVGALAIAESDPEYARKIIPAAVQSLPLALASYGPDGAWMEGVGYWGYATRYTAYGLTALKTGLGTDFGLLQIEGLSESGLFPIYCQGPTGRYLNFADCNGKNSRRPLPWMFWLTRTFHNPLFAESERVQLARSKASPGHIIWYVPDPKKDIPELPLDKYYHGEVEIALFRSSWDDPKGLWAGVKGGYNEVAHGHLDLGNFEMDALGVRWACDLGSDDYNLPGYFKGKPGGPRWNYYRLISISHNVPLLANENQKVKAKSKFIRCETNTNQPFVQIDLTEAYKDHASKVTRGVKLVEGRQAVLIQDEFEIAQPCEVAWGMTTEAKIEADKPNTAILTLEGQNLLACILSPEKACFTIESAEQKPPQSENKGCSRLMVRLPEQKGNVRVAILLAPIWPEGKVVKNLQVKSLEQW